MLEQIKTLLDCLGLKGITSCLDATLSDAEKHGTAVANVLLELLTAQHHYEQERRLESRIKRAKLPWSWHIDTFPFTRQPGVNKAQIMGLANLTFMQRNENIIFIGKPGTGKSGIAMSILRLALLNGHRGRFYNAQDMLNELYASLADRTTSKLLNILCAYEILVIDELGYLTLSPEQVNMFFKLIDMRYKRKSTIITTNLDFEDWYGVFQQKELVDAMLDRFKHYCTIIRIDGPSLRDPQSSSIMDEKPTIDDTSPK